MNKIIQKAMARAFFAVAWSEYQEGKDASFSQRDIMHCIPARIDPAAIREAKALCAAVGGMFSPDCGIDESTWGHYAAMQAMGAGVGLLDYDIDVEVPHIEFTAFNLDKNYRTYK